MRSRLADLHPLTITVESQGGIGNQLFIYAYARELHLRTGLPVAIDIWRHRLPQARRFRLDQLIGSELYISDTSYKVPSPIGSHCNLLRHWFQRVLAHLRPSDSVIHESTLAFNPDFLNPPSGSRLIGYFQSWRYFTRIAETLKSDLITARSRLASIDTPTLNGSCTAVHVRLGDYLLPRQRRTHGIALGHYYQEAIQRISALNPGGTFVIFSDEPEKASRLMSSLVPHVEFETHVSQGSDLSDLFSMSKFDRIICANSSFSWWAAWLGDRPDKEIFAPRNWIRRKDFCAYDLLPSAWNVLP